VSHCPGFGVVGSPRQINNGIPARKRQPIRLSCSATGGRSRLPHWSPIAAATPK
jgi:hypothetical protein